MNLFDNILNPKAKQAFSQTGQAIKSTFTPVTQMGQHATQSIKPIANTFGQVGSSVAKPFVDNYNYTKKVNQYYSPYRDAINQLGLTPEDIAQIPEDKKEAILNGLREIGVTLPEMPIPKSKNPIKNADTREGFVENFGLGTLDLFSGGVAQVPEVAGNTAEFIGGLAQYNPLAMAGAALAAPFSKKTYGEIRKEQIESSKAGGEMLGQAGTAGKEFIQKYGPGDIESTPYKIGGVGTELGSSLIGPNKVGILKKGMELYGAGKKLATAGKIGDIALEGGLAGAKYDVASKGEITPESVGVGALANVGVAGAIKGIGKTYQYATRKLPASLTLGGLINPGKLDVVKKGLMADEGVATPEDVGKWILDRVKPGNKQEIADQLIQHAEKTKGAVDEALASMPEYYKNNEAKKALMQIRNELEGKVGLEGRISQIDDMLAKPEYTLSELNAVKRELDNMYNMYTKTGDPTAGLKAEGLRNIRANIRKFIEDKADDLGVDIRKLNNETSTARGLADGILRKDSADGVRELLTAFAPSGAGAVIGAGQSMARGEDPLTVLRDAVIGGVATRVATSTAVRTRVASALNKLAPKELSALENYIRSGGKDAIGKKVAEKVIREGRALPARTITKEGDFAKPTEKSIITPQTQERAIIQESKTGLGSNVKRPNGNTNNTSNNNRNIPVGNDRGLTPVTPTPVKKVTPKKITLDKTETPVNNIRSTEGSNDFVSYFQKDLGDNITKEGLLKFGFTEKQILDNTYDFLKSKDNKLGVSLEDLFSIAKNKTTPKKITPTEKVEPKKVETNITRNETIEKGFSDSAKARWDKGEFTSKERGTATTYLKSNYKGKEYTIDGKKYKVDAIDNRNEQVRLVDSEGNIIRVKTNKLPETKVTDSDISNYYNGRVQKGYKTIKSPTKTTVNLQQSKGGFIKIPEIGKKAVKNQLVEEARKLKDKDFIAGLIKDTNLEKSVTNPTYIKIISSKFESEYNNIISGVMKNDMTSIEGLKRLKALQEKYKNTKADFTIKKGFGFSEDTKAVDAIKKSISRMEEQIKWEDKIRKQ